MVCEVLFLTFATAHRSIFGGYVLVVLNANHFEDQNNENYYKNMSMPILNYEVTKNGKLKLIASNRTFKLVSFFAFMFSF